MTRLCEAVRFVQWYGSEKALLVDDDGWPYVFAHLKVWPESEGRPAGALMGITLGQDGTLVCFLDPNRPPQLGKVTNQERAKKLRNGKPKYLKVGKIFLGDVEMTLPLAGQT